MTVSTFPIAAGADDGWRYRSDANYATLSTGSPSSNSGDASSNPLYATRETGYYITVALMRWDTSAIPDTDIISAASLEIYPVVISNPDSLSLIGDWYEPGTIGNEDWTTLPSGDALAAVALSSLTASAVNSLSLSNLGSISKTSYTGIRLGITRRAADAAPTGYNAVEIASYEHPSAQEPRLVVTHAAPAVARTLPLLGVG